MMAISSAKKYLQHAEIDLTMGRFFVCFINLPFPCFNQKPGLSRCLECEVNKFPSYLKEFYRIKIGS
jgi:hypothetical protein